MPVQQTTDEIYPDRWLKAEDIPDDGDLILTVADVNIEALGEKKDAKLVLVFRETTKDLALNKTNAGTLTELYGKDPNAWIGKRIALYATEVTYGGKTMLGVRVRLRPPAELKRRPPQQAVQELGYDTGEF